MLWQTKDTVLVKSSVK